MIGHILHKIIILYAIFHCGFTIPCVCSAAESQQEGVKWRFGPELDEYHQENPVVFAGQHNLQLYVRQAE